jgi:hypothetical protein
VPGGGGRGRTGGDFLLFGGMGILGTGFGALWDREWTGEKSGRTTFRSALFSHCGDFNRHGIEVES